MIFTNTVDGQNYGNHIEKKGKLATGFWCISIYSEHVRYFSLVNTYVKLRLSASYIDKDDYIKVKFDINFYDCIIAKLWFPYVKELNLSSYYSDNLSWLDTMDFAYDIGFTVFDGEAYNNSPKVYILLDDEDDYKKLFIELFKTKNYITNANSIKDVSSDEYKKVVDENGKVYYQPKDDDFETILKKNWKLILGVIILLYILSMFIGRRR